MLSTSPSNLVLSSISHSYSHPLFKTNPISISDFTLGKQLGRGGFGNVYEADFNQPFTRQRLNVALKIMEKQKIFHAKMVQRVQKEVEILSRLRNPSILQLYHFFEDESSVYLVMEHCENGELYRYLQNRRKSNLPPLSESEVRHVMLQILRGIEYLQRLGIIHRDLKLSNILLTKTYDIKIADFGLAARLSGPDGEQLTMCGTPNYISPEIVQRKPYGLASDMWSIGCMFYTMLSGHPPFESTVVKNTLDLVSRAVYDIPPNLSAEANDLIRQLLQKDPSHRLTIDQVIKHHFFRYGSTPLKDICRLTPQETVDDLPEISTANLKPLKQSTKHGSIELNDVGWIIMDFTDDKYRIAINSDGKNILFFLKPVDESRWSLNSPPTHNCTKSTIPEKYQKRYRYAAKFIQVIRSKTPKITFYSPQAKCQFMDNAEKDGLNDFDVYFYSGERILWNLGKCEVNIKENNPQKEVKILAKVGIPRINCSVDVDSLGEQVSRHIPPEYQILWKHLLECYKQCWEIARTVDKQKFPLILKAGMSNPSDLQSSQPIYESRAPSVHMSELQSPGSALGLSQFQTPNGLKKSLNNPTLDFRSSTMTSHQVSTRIIGRGDENIFVYIQNIGWCMKQRQKGTNNLPEFVLLFIDGTRLSIQQHSSQPFYQYQNIVATVEQPKARILYVSTDGREECFDIDRNLPLHVKEKLAKFPMFIEKFNSN